MGTGQGLYVSKCKSRNPGNVKVEIQAGARCQLIRLCWENFSAIDVRCLSCGLPSPPLSPRIRHHPHPEHHQHQQGSKGEDTEDFSSMYVWHLAGGEAGLGCRQSNGPSFEPRGFGKPSPTYPATFSSNIPPTVLTIRFLLPIFQNGC